MEAVSNGLELNNLEMKNMIYYGINDVVIKYDEKLFHLLQERNYDECDQALTDFCFELLELKDSEQVFIARIFYISIITDVIRMQQRKGRLHPRNLIVAYNLIAKIEKWENVSEFILNNSFYIDELSKNIIADEVLFQGCEHITKAVQLIEDYLKSPILTVSWLAQELKISSTHLTNLFKLRIGEPVSTYIAKKKLNEIVFEMTYTAKSLKEIRKEYGYTNHSHFIQQFKKHYGKTPLSYIKDLRTE